MGLQEILDEIRKEAETEHQDIVTQAKFEADKLVVRKLDELSAVYEKKYDTLETEMKRLSAKLLARAELDAERLKQHAEVEIIENMIRDAYTELSGTIRQERSRYSAFLIRLAEKAAGQLSGNGEIGLSFRKEDEQYLEDIRTSVKRTFKLLPASKISGGIICMSGEIYLDYSLDNLFRKLRPELVRQISEYFRD